jgi:hypothetical protein
MMLPGLFVTVRSFPCWLKLALPFTTFGPVGLASAASGRKQQATAAAIRLRRLVLDGFMSGSLMLILECGRNALIIIPV